MLENKITFRPSVEEQVRRRVEQDKQMALMTDRASKLSVEKELQVFQANHSHEFWHPSYGYAISLMVILLILLALM